jgi:lipase maturation factor 1
VSSAAAAGDDAARLFSTRAVLLRLLGLVHLIAFGSLWLQVDGLVSSRGILPVAPWLERVDAIVEGAAWLRAPTLLWLWSDDAALHFLCAIGVLCALAVMAGVATFWMLAILWVGYLSLAVAGQTFLQFQWDALLLETTLCALFLVPFAWRPGVGLGRAAPDPRPGIWLLRTLLFKLMFLSGAVKLLSLDETWLDGKALEFHYWTQPLPLASSWWVHHLPAWAHRLSSWTMLVIELLVPFLIFAPRRARLVAAGVLVAFQVLIVATGNYGFFNFLTLVLCVSLLDDGALRLARRRPAANPAGRQPIPPPWLRWAFAVTVLSLSFVVSVRELVYTVPRHELRPDNTWGPAVLETAEGLVLEPTDALLEWIAPFRSINGYGLFRVMTTSRPEIAVEVSDDGASWRELAFRFKPGDPAQRPRWATPHMPRLDWQMWFAALAPRQAGWLQPFTQRLLEGEPAVWRLVGEDLPTAGPPRFLRLAYHDYRFTTRAERRENGTWWQRERLGELTGPLQIEVHAPPAEASSLRGSATRRQSNGPVG